MRVLLAIGMALLLLGCTAQETAAAINDSGEGGIAKQELRTGHLIVPGRPLIMDGDGTQEPQEIPEYDFGRTHEDGKLMVYFFYSPGCSACKAIIPEIDGLEASYPDALFLRYDLSTRNGSEAYKQFAQQHNLSSDRMYVPQVLVNGTIITDRFNINQSLEAIISAS